jgi:hypothetical protein
MKMYYTGDNLSLNEQARSQETLFSRIFGVKSEAQAKTIPGR